jgi:uncharacterized protein YoxC
VVPVVIVVALGIASTAFLAAILVGMIRTLTVLSKSLARFREDVQPLLEDVRKGTEHSQEVLERISSREVGARPGDRIRR